MNSTRSPSATCADDTHVMMVQDFACWPACWPTSVRTITCTTNVRTFGVKKSTAVRSFIGCWQPVPACLFSCQHTHAHTYTAFYVRTHPSKCRRCFEDAVDDDDRWLGKKLLIWIVIVSLHARAFLRFVVGFKRTCPRAFCDCVCNNTTEAAE